MKQKQKIMFASGLLNLYRNNRNKYCCFETNSNKPKEFFVDHTSPGAAQALETDTSRCSTRAHDQMRHRSCTDTRPDAAQKLFEDRHVLAQVQ
jgi:hypothetical protein